MASVKFLTLLAVLCTCYGLCHGDVITTQKPVLIDVPKPADSTPVLHVELAVPKHLATVDPLPTSSAAPTSTPVPDTTTSTTPTTTSTTPSTTTSTTTTTTSTTTPAPPPPTPPTPAPAPTPAPGPLPPPDQGMWWYTGKDNITCVMVQFAAQLNITYFQLNSTKESHAIFNFPSNATVTNGSCNETEQWIELSWPANDDSAMNTLTLVFQANETTKTYEMKAVNVSLSPKTLVNASVTDNIDLWHGRGWETPLASSYRCAPSSALKLTSGDNTNIAGIVTVSRLQEEAFRKTSARGFSAARDCGGGDVPDAVPIAVGCALGGLVLVVLAAYLLARRRSAARGYLSM